MLIISYINLYRKEVIYIKKKRTFYIINLLISFIVSLPLNVKFLICLIILDFASGLLKSLYGNSDKSDTGYLSSKAIKKGFISKVSIFLLLAVAFYIDSYINGSGYIFNYTIVYFCIESCVSIMENVSCCGVKVPTIMREKLDINKGE